jgi:hypothetical protein
VTIPVANGRNPNEANDFNCEEEMPLGAMNRLTPETAAKHEAADAPMDAEDPGNMRCSFAEKARGGAQTGAMRAMFAASLSRRSYPPTSTSKLRRVCRCAAWCASSVIWTRKAGVLAMAAAPAIALAVAVRAVWPSLPLARGHAMRAKAAL